MAQPKLHVTERAMIAVVAGGAALIPLIVDTRLDEMFRFPKELAFRGEAIIVLALAAMWAAARTRTWTIEWRRPDYYLVAAVVIWSGITALTSTNRVLSVDAYVTIVAAAVIYIATTVVAQSAGIAVIDLVMASSCINAVIVILQETRVWNPFRFAADMAGHMSSTALIGNPNDVGTYLLVPLLAAMIMVVVSRGARRWIYLAITLVLLGGIVASSTRTAIAAFVVAAVFFAVTRSIRAVIVVAAVLAIVVLIALQPSTTLGQSVRAFREGLRQQRYDVVFSQRLPLFLSAVDMFRDHPLTGVGPGCYGYHDMGYRMQLPRHYPVEWTRGWAQKAGQTHNDHLQVAAETGVPGYALLLAVFFVAGTAPRRTEKKPEPLERRFAAAFLPPFAVAVFVVMLAQFPMELAAPRLMILTFGGLTLTWLWSDDHDA